MKLKLGIIVLIIITILNIAAWSFLDFKIAELQSERNKIIHANWELLESSGNAKDIFDYIQERNPKMTIRELSDYVSYSHQLADDYKDKQYPVTVWEIFEISDIESNFNLSARGAAGEVGPMQILPSTWGKIYKRFGFKPADFENWYCNMAAATYHYSELKSVCRGDSVEAIGRYNGGYRWKEKFISRNHVRKYQRASRGMREVR